MKIVTIGAGSVAWGPIINTDFLLNPDLDGAELMLMDISAENLGRVQRLLERYIRERGFNKTIKATTNLEEALKDADYVITAISVGGDHLWRYDSMFPQIYSVYQPVGDTIGPGGLVRALRHAGPLLQIGRMMREVSKPDVTMIQLTNPMNPLCAALEQLGGLKIYGICHGVDDTRRHISESLEVPIDEVDVVMAGNNHLIWADEITVSGEVYNQERIPELTPKIYDTPFREESFKRYGTYVGNTARHPIEFLPDFLTQEHGFGKDWGVLPLAVQVDPMMGDRHDVAYERLERALAQKEPIVWSTEHRQGGLRVNDDGLVETGHSREGLDEFIVALESGNEFKIHINAPNAGAIEGVDPAYNIEFLATFKNGELHRHPVTFNDKVTAEINRVGKEQYLIGQACLEYDEDVLIEALSLDALVSTKDLAARLVREMVAYQRDYLAPYYPV
jgi:alpha-galactosidase